jgi:hypothetical protein
MMPISRAQLLEQLLPGLEQIFGMEYAKYTGTQYVKRCRYGKYSIYRWDYDSGKRRSATLATGLSKEEAEGMMKLLQEPK